MLFELVSLSVVLSLVCTEFTGLFAGGLVSAGYFAYYFHEPSRLLSTIAVAVVIENGNSSTRASSVAADIFDYYFAGRNQTSNQPT